MILKDVMHIITCWMKLMVSVNTVQVFMTFKQQIYPKQCSDLNFSTKWWWRWWWWLVECECNVHAAAAFSLRFQNKQTKEEEESGGQGSAHKVSIRSQTASHVKQSEQYSLFFWFKPCYQHPVRITHGNYGGASVTQSNTKTHSLCEQQ